MSLQDARTLNREIITVSESMMLFHRDGLSSVCHDGKIIDFTLETSEGTANVK